MNWNGSEYYSDSCMIELEEGAPFWDSPIGFNLDGLSLESPPLQNPEVKSYLGTFKRWGNSVWIGIDKHMPVIDYLPCVFLIRGPKLSAEQALSALNEHLPVPYEPYHDFHILGYFPGRFDTPVREILRDGSVYEGNKKIGTEFITNPPEWAHALASKAREHRNCFLNHYKVSEDGHVKKAYVITTS